MNAAPPKTIKRYPEHPTTSRVLLIFVLALLFVFCCGFNKDASADIRLIRRMDRDCTERGRTFAQVVDQYHKTVRPMHELYVEPCKQVADLIVHSAESPSTADPNNSSPHRLDVPCQVLENHLRAVAGLVEEEKPPESLEGVIAAMHSSVEAAAAANP
jgi:Phosphoribulokinase / Uridine kinase family